MGTFAALVLILASWAAMGAVLAGVGLVVQRRDPRNRFTTASAFRAFWLGLALLIAYLQLWHFVAPIGFGAWVLPAVMGALGAATHRQRLLAAVRRFEPPAPPARVIGGVALAFTLWTAFAATGYSEHAATGSYHLQAVQWAQAYRLVPGLGLLDQYAEYAFTGSWSLVGSLFGSGPWDGHATNLTNGFVLVALALDIAARLSRAWVPTTGPGDGGRPGAVPLTAAAGALLIPAVFARLMGDEVASLAPQIPLLALSSASVLSLVDWARRLGRTGAAEPGVTAAALLLVLPSVKPSAAIAGLGIAAVGVLWARRHAAALFPGGRRGRARALRSPHAVAPAIAPAIALGVAFAGGALATPIRSAVLTGYPLFPATFFGLPVSWRVPGDSARRTHEYLTLAARLRPPQDRASLHHWSWLQPWFYERIQEIDLKVPILLLVLAGAAAVAVRHQPGRGRDLVVSAFPFGRALATAALLSAVVWFFQAPDPSEARGFLWPVAAVAAAWALTRAFGRKAVAISLLAGALLSLVTFAPSRFRVAGYGLKSRPPTEVDTVTLPSGLAVNRPTAGPACWDAPRPCWPEPYSGLQLRGTTPRDGFSLARPTRS